MGMKVNTANRLAAAFLPLFIFLPLYEIYYHAAYYSDKYEPKEYKNWGYIILGIFFIIRAISLSFAKSENGYKGLLEKRLLAYNFLAIIISLLLFLNIMGVIILLQPRFLEMMMLLVVSFVSTRILLNYLNSNNLLE